MKNPSDFSPQAVKRSKRKQYIIWIAIALMACITIFCISSIFAKPIEVEPATEKTNPTLPVSVETATEIVAPVFPPTWTPKPPATDIPSTPTLEQVILPTQQAFTFTMPGGSCIPNNPIEVAEVIEIVDGDTIHVRMNGKDYPVRYIGIDTPEMNGDPFSKEAKSYNSQLVAGKTVMMIKDHSEVDRFDRLLRYVIVGNIFVNYDLVEKGIAHAKDYPPDSACSPILVGAQDSAKLFELGLWALAAAPLVDTSRSGVVEDPRTGCDPSYPDVCIPPPPPDLDCGDISFRRFKVLPADPHRFDGSDDDGIGCEGN